jgi:hypothetical protein
MTENASYCLALLLLLKGSSLSFKLLELPLFTKKEEARGDQGICSHDCFGWGEEVSGTDESDGKEWGELIGDEATICQSSHIAIERYIELLPIMR